MKLACKTLIVAMAVSVAPAALAEGISVKPGLWEMKTVMNMPMMPEPRVSTIQECMETDEINMDEIATNGLEENCTFNMEQLGGDTMKWTVDCPVEGGTSHGEWEATSTGDKVIGKGVMTISYSGQAMKMDMSWEGRHIGDCPQ